VSGHVADSLMNMETVRAFAIRSWGYANLRIDTLVAPMSVLANTLELLLAVSLGGGRLGVEAIVVTFTITRTRPASCSSSTTSIGGWRAA
jgi:ATP-binding cassette subfamily B protein